MASAARAKPFRARRTGDQTLDGIQQDLADTLDQLEDARRGVLAGPAIVTAVSVQLDDALVAVYTGSVAGTFMLPRASALGAGKAQAMFIGNAGAANLTLATSGSDTVNGAASVVIAAGGNAVVYSDGATNWRKF